MPPHPPKFRKSYQKHDGFLELFGHFDIINQSQSKITHLGTSLKWYKIFLCNIMTSRYILSPQFASEWFWRQPLVFLKEFLLFLCKNEISEGEGACPHFQKIRESTNFYSIHLIIFLNESSRCLVYRKIKSGVITTFETSENEQGIFFSRKFPDLVPNYLERES